MWHCAVSQALLWCCDGAGCVQGDAGCAQWAGVLVLDCFTWRCCGARYAVWCCGAHVVWGGAGMVLGEHRALWHLREPKGD